MALSNIPEYYPDLELAGKAARRIDGGDPLQGPIGKPAEEIKGNTGNLDPCSLRQAHCANVRLSFVMPPGKKIFFLQAMSRERVIDDGGRLVPKTLACASCPKEIGR